MIFVKRLKKLISAILYFIILHVVRLLFINKKGNNHLLVIKTDEIGDFVLLHNYLKYFKQLDKFKGYKLTFIGNASWEQIFKTYDNGIFDQVIWLNKKKFIKSISYRFNFLKSVRLLSSSYVINLIFSRSLNIDDSIAWVANGRYKIAMFADDTNRGFKSINYDNFIYTNIINAGSKEIFDGIRNRNYFSMIFENPEIPVEMRLGIKEPLNIPIAGKYYIMFLGAGNAERKWGINNFLLTANFIYDNYGFSPIICGGNEDRNDAEFFVSNFKNQATNLVGKTTLIELINLFCNSRFLISVDTGALHIAASVRCPVIGLFSGKFYGRFAPYPKEITEKFYPFYPDFVDSLISENNPILYDTTLMKNDTIKMIRPIKIFPIIETILCNS